MNETLIFRALADDTRRNVVRLLLRHEYCVSELAAALKVSKSAVSQHIRVLKAAGLLTGDRRGHYRHYTINREMLRALAGVIRDLADTERQPCAKHGACRCHGPGHACGEECGGVRPNDGEAGEGMSAGIRLPVAGMCAGEC